MATGLRDYALVTAAYWGFTLTDGALRMLVLLHFHTLGYSPFEIALLFLFYEVFGIVTNLVGGWIGARFGLRLTLFAGLAIQVFALVMLAQVSPQWVQWLSIAYVMTAQALSGIAKDLTKMSSKSAVKLVVPGGARSGLYKWVAILTGSKNALKGAGFFVGAALLTALGFAGALYAMAGALALVLFGSVLMLEGNLGKSRDKPPFRAVFSKSRDVNILSAARFFLFGSRDVWFVVALPVFLHEALGWGFAGVGGFMAAWVIGYGIVQGAAPKLSGSGLPRAAAPWAFVLAALPAGIALGLWAGYPPTVVVVAGLALFGVVFAVNSALHSYLILYYSDHDKVALNVGFYYMANAAGRLLGTVLSGAVYQGFGLAGCLWVSSALVIAAGAIALFLKEQQEDATA